MEPPSFLRSSYRQKVLSSPVNTSTLSVKRKAETTPPSVLKPASRAKKLAPRSFEETVQKTLEVILEGQGALMARLESMETQLASMASLKAVVSDFQDGYVECCRCNSENIPGHNIPAGKFWLGKLFLGIFWLAKIFRLRPGISFRKGKSWFALVKIFRAKLGNQNAISKSRIHLRGSIELFSRVIRTPSAVMKPAAFERIALFLESSEQLYFLSERYRKTSS